MNITSERLEKLGFKRASGIVKDLKDKQRKMAIAYEHFRFVRQERIDAFNSKLKEKTKKGKPPYNETYQELSFQNVSDYEKTPPSDVLSKMEEACEKMCFDSYEVAFIKEVKDPILFGRVKGCPDRFYIAQWDDDVKIEDILNEKEG